MRVRLFSFRDSGFWDDFCETAITATFLHTRRFLSYHGERFEDRSLLVESRDAHLVGILPAALDPSDKSRVVSHPGITFGGLVHAGDLRGDKMLEAWQLISDFYRDMGLKRILYKALPYIYSKAPMQDDLYALFRLGATRYRCDLSCAIDLSSRLPTSSRRRRSFSKAHSRRVSVEYNSKAFGDYWHVLEENLMTKHAVRPVHTFEEIREIKSRFSRQVVLVVARCSGNVEAGVILFNSPRVFHAQYMAATEAGKQACALDAVVERCIQEAKVAEACYFDFGISNEDQGAVLNSGLYAFKSEFGAGGVVHEFYNIAL